MRILSAGLLGFGLMVATGVATATAQESLRGPGGAIGGFHLIAMPAIQRELRLDPGQVRTAQGVATRMNDRFRQDMGKLKGLNQDQQAKRLVTLADAHYDEGMKQLRPFLKPEQLDRFDQILFQQRGPMAMLEPKIVEALQVRNEQAQRVAELVTQARNDQKKVVEAEGKDNKSTVVKLEEIAARANEKAIEILSPEQKRTWLRIVGQPFRPDLGGGISGEGTAKSAQQP